MTQAVKVKNLSFIYNEQEILRDINLIVPDKTFIGIIGPNGAGKTTLFKLIAGLLKPTHGQITIFDQPVNKSADFIGYLPQYSFHDQTFPMTVLEVVLMGLISQKKLFKPYSKTDINASLEALSIVEMTQFKNHQISQLSGGQKQRILLARSIVAKPKLLLLDEPLAGIDVCMEFEFYELLKSLKQRMAIIMISHDIGAVSQQVDAIACMNKTLFIHDDKEIVLKHLDHTYGCPVDIIAHGIPHRVFKDHKD